MWIYVTRRRRRLQQSQLVNCYYFSIEQRLWWIANLDETFPLPIRHAELQRNSQVIKFDNTAPINSTSHSSTIARDIDWKWNSIHSRLHFVITRQLNPLPLLLSTKQYPKWDFYYDDLIIHSIYFFSRNVNEKFTFFVSASSYSADKNCMPRMSHVVVVADDQKMNFRRIDVRRNCIISWKSL